MTNTPFHIHLMLSTAALSALLVACGGGGDSPEPLPPATHSVGGEVSGLYAGMQVTLKLNGGESVVVRNPGPLTFSFPSPLAHGSAYSVTLDSAHSDRNCRIDNGAGTVSAAVRNVQVRCADVFAFVANIGVGGGVSRYAMGTDGQLSLLGTTPAGNPQHVVLSPDGKYAYVANGSDANILQFSVGSDGSLTPLSPAAVSAGTSTSHYVTQVVLDGSGHAWATNWDEGRIYQYTVAANGALVPHSTPWVWGPSRPSALAYEGNCHCVIVSETRLDGDLQVFDVAADGGLNFKMTYGASGSGSGLLVLGSRGWVYAAGQNQIAQWNLSRAGALSGYAVTPTDWARALASDPNGQVVWAVSQGRSSIRPYQVGAGGALTAGTEVTSGSLSRPTAIASNGRHVYVTNSASNTVSQYAVNSTTTGALTPLPTPNPATGQTPNSITLY